MTTLQILIIAIAGVILPVLIVWLVMRAKQNVTAKKAEIIHQAIEAGIPVDVDKFIAPKNKPDSQSKLSLKQDLLGKLSGAGIFFFMGLSFLILYFVDQFGPGIPNGLWFLNGLAMAGGVMMAIGISLFITYFAGRKLLKKEMEE
ncbi:MAG: hypothetical protein J6T04_10085 [Bacteroidales bacterium]|nr:hypothetical protein [Bacteroidales bacterium]